MGYRLVQQAKCGLDDRSIRVLCVRRWDRPNRGRWVRLRVEGHRVLLLWVLFFDRRPESYRFRRHYFF